MMVRCLLATVAWCLAVLLVVTAFDGVPRDLVGLQLWQLHTLAALFCGMSAAVRVARSRPFLYGLFVATAVLIPIFGPIFVLLLGALARKEAPCPAVPVQDPYICGVPLRESRRGGVEGGTVPFISRIRSLNADRLAAVLSNIVKLENAPLWSLNRRFRNHPDTKVRLVGQACLADRLNRLDGHIRQLQARLEKNAEDADAILGLCEVHLSILDQRLVIPQDRDGRGRAGMEWARRLGLLDASSRTAAAYYETRFALHLGERELATGAWARLVEVSEELCVASPGDRFHLLGAEVGLARGDLAVVREHADKLEPDSASKFWLQEFWLESMPRDAS